MLRIFRVSQHFDDVLGTVLILELNKINFLEKFQEVQSLFEYEIVYSMLIQFNHFYLNKRDLNTIFRARIIQNFENDFNSYAKSSRILNTRDFEYYL